MKEKKGQMQRGTPGGWGGGTGSRGEENTTLDRKGVKWKNTINDRRKERKGPVLPSLKKLKKRVRGTRKETQRIEKQYTVTKRISIIASEKKDQAKGALRGKKLGENIEKKTKAESCRGKGGFIMDAELNEERIPPQKKKKPRLKQSGKRKIVSKNQTENEGCKSGGARVSGAL